ncbi:MAG: putative glycolipid-binding domain-containing protein [Bauldia sp.]
MAFRPFAPLTARWRFEHDNGLEHLDLDQADEGILADGVVIGDRDGVPYGVRYRMILDSRWTALTLDIETTDGRGLHLSSDGAGSWIDEAGRGLAQFDGCIDIDLAGSPFTNTLPIRRLELSPEMGATEFRMLYVPFTTCAPAVDRQRYLCLERQRLYRYEAVDRSFTVDLTVDDDGPRGRLPDPVSSGPCLDPAGRLARDRLPHARQRRRTEGQARPRPRRSQRADG